jgi:hypothetical protein
MNLHACTIVTPDHVARARVLARSLREHHPDARCTVLVVGDPPASAEPFEVLGIEALDCSPLEEMIAAYEPFALGCALKPWLLSHLLEQSPAVLYLDSDIRVYAPLDDAFAAVERHGLVLTRHLLGPLPRDGRHPLEETSCWPARSTGASSASVAKPGASSAGGRSEWLRSARWTRPGGCSSTSAGSSSPQVSCPTQPCCATRAATPASGTCRTDR